MLAVGTLLGSAWVAGCAGCWLYRGEGLLLRLSFVVVCCLLGIGVWQVVGVCVGYSPAFWFTIISGDCTVDQPCIYHAGEVLGVSVH